ncbi:MAG: glutamate--tRNA ligase family protein [Candidatus Nanoarchaeia archaeon]
MKNFDEITRAYAIKNALSYEGKAQIGSVISSLFHEGLKKEDMKKYGKEISKIVDEVNSLSLEDQKKEFEKIKDFTSERPSREGLPELPDVPKTGIVTRFRPSPSGPLHVGHLISNLISSLYVKKYGGKFYVIIDDTNPQTIVPESYKKIKDDCDWVFGNVYQYLNASDRIESYYKFAEELIEKKAAYVCTCSSNNFKEYIEKEENCPCRKLTVKQNLERWKRMLDKNGFGEGEAVLRFKSDMKHKNPAMRDFPLARINETEHPLQKNKYRVWPLMNLAVVADDIELKMTHIIRGKDHRDNAERQRMIYKVFNKKFPWTFFIGRIKFTDLILSKRKLTAAIESGEFSGEEDERLPTIASLRKRGYKPEAFAKFVEQRGLTEVDKVIGSKEFFQVIDQFSKN